MKNIVPQRLQQGDEIRIVAPSTGIKIIGADCRQIAKERFETLGLKVSFGQYTTDDNFDEMGSSSIEMRARDIMDAFQNENVKAIFTIIGGFNSNQVLPYLDYDVIMQHPKVICGFSDITALLDGIRAKTGLIVFYGPHYSSLGMKKGCDYTFEMMQKMLFGGNIVWQAASEWSDDLWFLDQDNRQIIPNDGWWVLNSGQARGMLEGGNLGTFVLLNGTPYQLEFKENTILALEDCFTAASSDAKYFLRQLQAVAERDDFKNVKALLIGRFQKESGVSRDLLAHIIGRIPQLKNIPVIANMDFGHTTPIATLPLGGTAEINGTEIKLSW